MQIYFMSNFERKYSQKFICTAASKQITNILIHVVAKQRTQLDLFVIKGFVVLHIPSEQNI